MTACAPLAHAFANRSGRLPGTNRYERDAITRRPRDRAYPKRWIGKVRVQTTDGRTLEARVDEPKGDPGNTLSRGELADKALRLAEFSGAATRDEVGDLCARLFGIATAPRIGWLLPP